MKTPLRLGISRCLLGERVRYDGDHKLDPYLVHTLGPYVQYVPVCPEIECGLPVPREPLRLAGDPGSPRLVATPSNRDLTLSMNRWARKRALQLGSERLSGFVFKSRSPSCGMDRVKVYQGNRVISKQGTGLFARAFTQHHPLVPVEQEDRLYLPRVRDNFIERVFVFKAWRDMGSRVRRIQNLADLHRRHELLILAHSPKHLRHLARLLEGANPMGPGVLSDSYIALLMEALRLEATPKKTARALHRVLKILWGRLSPSERQELSKVLDLYRGGGLPLIVPVTLINHYVRRYGDPYLESQAFLHPHPAQLQLRNHA